MAKQYTLGKEERLKSRKRIEQLFKTGRTLNVFPFRVFYLLNRVTAGTGKSFPKDSGTKLQFGAGAGTRNFKKAVDRNRIKRVIREAWRLQKNILPAKLKAKNTSLDVFIIYTAKELPDYDTVYNKVHVILEKLAKLIDENNPQVP